MKKFSHIRNFAIIAHIDHGKSTIADRLIQTCGGLEQRELKAQVLDSMEVERERGITVKAQTVKLDYHYQGQDYQLNLIDTPGHVDFGYEVSRSLSACEGSILVVDASQGVEAQTMANVYKAIENEHELIIALNKIDLPAADPERVKEQIAHIIGIDDALCINVSAKTGQGIDTLLQAIVSNLPAPQGEINSPLTALLVDSWYDKYLGIIILVRVINGKIERGMRIKMMSNNTHYQVEQVGVFTPKKKLINRLQAGEVGFITGSIKHVKDCKVGDTITELYKEASTPLPGFKPSQPVVFCGLFPTDSNEYDNLKDALSKLHLNDSSFSYEVESSAALGFGFRCGFLGLLHLEIIKDRLEKEFDIAVVATAPSVIYRLHMKNGETKDLCNPADMPDMVKIDFIQEPLIKATIMIPETYVGDIISLCIERRGVQISMDYSSNRMILVYKLPLAEIVFDFYDRLKSISQGYASFDYEMTGYERGEVCKVGLLINEEPVEALSFISHRSSAESRGRSLCLRLKELIPRHLFKIPIQASIGGKVIARETISALRKDVTAKCYGGDITRKRKLLDKQKKGKAKLKQFGRVEIPQDAFLKALKSDS